MLRHISLLAVAASAALAWGALPELPAAYSVRETTQLGMVVSAGGRSKSMSRRFRNGGTIEIADDRTLRVAIPDGFFTDADADWTPSGRSALRFVLTDGSKTEIEAQLASALSMGGLDAAVRCRFSPGRLSFNRTASRVTGSEVTRMTAHGRYRGQRFSVWLTARMSWRGTSA